MDFSSTAISLLIVWYGVYEYRRREKAHRAAMEHLRRTEVLPAAASKPLARGEVLPAAGSQGRSWNLLATGSVCALLAGFAGMLFYTGVHSHDNSAMPMEIMGCMITVPLLLLVLIFVRDLRRYAGSRHGEREPGR